MKIGCNIYGLRYELVEKGAEEVIRKLSECGITSIEPFYNTRGAELEGAALESFWPSDVTADRKAVIWTLGKIKKMKVVLEELGMSISSVHASRIGDNETNAKAYIKLYQETGIDHVIVSKEFHDLKGCEDAAQMVNELSRMVQDAGVTIVYHNHASECKEVEVNGKKKMLLDYFTELTDEHVKFQVDVGWLLSADCDPVAYLNKVKDRIACIHYKDIVANHHEVAEEKMCAAIGKGILPSKDILILCKDIPLMNHGIIIDQDEPSEGSDLFDDLKYGADTLNELWKNL